MFRTMEMANGFGPVPQLPWIKDTLLPSSLSDQSSILSPKDVEDIVTSLASLSSSSNGWSRVHSHCFHLIDLISTSEDVASTFLGEWNLPAIVSSALTEHRERILCLTGSEADAFMCLLQQILDSTPKLNAGRVVFLDVLLKLAIKANLIPRTLNIEGITDRSELPITGGGFGDVWKASWRGRRVALKTPRLGLLASNPEKVHKNLCQEVLLWRQLRHPHLLEFLGICKELPPYTAIVSPWMENETVLKFVQENPGTDRLKLLIQIASALAYLHTHEPPVIHQDVRAANILVNEYQQAMLGDFGISRIDSEIFHSMRSNMNLGCTRWQAPEILFPDAKTKSITSSASDMWAFGMVILELFTENIPFAHAATDPAVIIDIYHDRLPERPAASMVKGAGLSDCVWACIEHCWAKLPIDRPQASEVMEKLEAETFRSFVVMHSPAYRMSSPMLSQPACQGPVYQMPASIRDALGSARIGKRRAEIEDKRAKSLEVQEPRNAKKMRQGETRQKVDTDSTSHLASSSGTAQYQPHYIIGLPQLLSSSHERGGKIRNQADTDGRQSNFPTAEILSSPADLHEESENPCIHPVTVEKTFTLRHFHGIAGVDLHNIVLLQKVHQVSMLCIVMENGSTPVDSVSMSIKGDGAHVRTALDELDKLVEFQDKFGFL